MVASGRDETPAGTPFAQRIRSRPLRDHQAALLRQPEQPDARIPATGCSNSAVLAVVEDQPERLSVRAMIS